MKNRVSVSALSVSVVVPTWQRADDLRRCLTALVDQERPADQVVIVHRSDDYPVQPVVDEFVGRLPIETVIVTEPGLAPASNVGFSAATGDVVARLDDDAEPWRPWLTQVLSWFERRPDVGGVCGRDWVQTDFVKTQREKRRVGVIAATGRIIGNHHLGVGGPREVHLLKGAGMAFRRDAVEGLEFSSRALQHGRHIHDDAEMSQAVRARGWRLIYDPAISIDHHPGNRPVADRDATTPDRAAHVAFRETVAFEPHLDWGTRVRYRGWAHLVGDRVAPGLVHALRDVVRGRAANEVVANLQGAIDGRRKARQSLRSDPIPSGRPHDRYGSDGRLRCALVGHDVGTTGGMERAAGELITRTSEQIDWVVISSSLAHELADLVTWEQVPTPPRPFLAKYATFAALAAPAVHRHRDRIVITIGAIVPNQVDVGWVHFSHHGFRAAAAVGGRPGQDGLHRLNTELVGAASRFAETASYRRGRVARLVAVSEGTAAEARTFHNVDVDVAPNGVDLDRFRPDEREGLALRAELGIAASALVVAFVGGDWDRKGVPALVDAMARLDHEAHLLIAGDGDGEAIRQRASAQVRDRVHVLGVRDDVHRVLNAADVLAAPSAYETFHLVVYEAAACGLAIVATPVSGVTDLIEHERSGLLIDGSTDSLVDALNRLLNDQPLRKSLGLEARTRAQSFDWDASATAMVEIIEGLYR